MLGFAMEILSVDGSEEERIGDVGDRRSIRDQKKKMNHKKPPRPPKGPSINASDHKLIQEISECASLKRARVERIRALKKAREASTSSSPSSSYRSSNVAAMVFTIIFFLVIIFQGMSPRVNSTSSGIEQTPGFHVPVHTELSSKTSSHDLQENRRRSRRRRRMLD